MSADLTSPSSPSPSADAAPRSTGASPLALGPLGGLIAALVGGILGWWAMGIVGPVFTVPSEFHIPNLGAPAEKFAALAAQQKIVDRNNAMLDLAVVGACLGALLGLAESIARRSLRTYPGTAVAAQCGRKIAAPPKVLGSGLRAILLAPACAAVIAAAGGCVAGAVGAWCFDAVAPDGYVPGLRGTMALQAAILAALGGGAGLGLAAATCRGRAAAAGLIAGLLAGALAGMLYPVLASFLFPAANTESMVPAGAIPSLLWISLLSALVGLLVPAMVKSKPRTSAPAE